MKAIILGAGQGRRLLPLTADIPKALLDVGGKTLIRRQIDALASAGIEDFVVITGYGAEKMEQAVEAIARERLVAIRTLYNPFFQVADNLVRATAYDWKDVAGACLTEPNTHWRAICLQGYGRQASGNSGSSHAQ